MIEQRIALGLVIISAVALVILLIYFRRKGMEARTYPVFHSLADEVGRVAEEGATIHIALGSGGLASEHVMTSVAAMQGLKNLLDLSAAYDTPPLITTGDPTLYLLAGHWMRRAYNRLGNVRLYRSQLVRFVGASPTTYAAMAATNLSGSGIGSNIVLGELDHEAALLLSAAQQSGVHTAGGTTSLLGLAALYPYLEPQKLVMGEDVFAAGAEVLGQPIHYASLWTEHILRWLVAAGIALMAFLSLIGIGGR